MTSRVFIVQEPVRWNRVTGEPERKFDLRPAAAYGRIEILLDGKASVLNTAPVVHTLRRKLADFGPDDFLVATGNPTAIGIAVAIAAYNNRGWVTLLVWHGPSRSYIANKANIFGEIPELENV